MVQSAEGGKGKDSRERIIVVVRSPCQENYPADAHPSAHKSVLESANPALTRSVHLDAPGQRHGQQPVCGTADPGGVKQNKSSRGSVDTPRTRSDPQRVRMCSGERPIERTNERTPWPRANPTPPPPRPARRGQTGRMRTGHGLHSAHCTTWAPLARYASRHLTPGVPHTASPGLRGTEGALSSCSVLKV